MTNITTVFPNQPPTVPVLLTEEERKNTGRKWMYRLENDFAYESEDSRILVPGGFVFDGASVPRLAWSASGLTPDGLIRAAAVVHDYLYRFDGALPPGSLWTRTSAAHAWEPVKLKFTRKQADQLFKRIMAASGIRKSQVFLAYWAVRLGARRW